MMAASNGGAQRRLAGAPKGKRSHGTAANILVIEHIVTADMDDGQPSPPHIDNDVLWRVVRRADGHTLWRKIFLHSKPNSSAHARRAADC